MKASSNIDLDLLTSNGQLITTLKGSLPPGTVALDHSASVLLHGHRREHPQSDPRDLVSAAVEFFLSDGRLSSAEALEAATDRRMALEKGKEDAR